LFLIKKPKNVAKHVFDANYMVSKLVS